MDFSRFLTYFGAVWGVPGMIFGARGGFWGILGLLWANCGVSCCFGIVFPYLGTFFDVFFGSLLAFAWACFGLLLSSLLASLALLSPLAFAYFPPRVCSFPLLLLAPLAFACFPCLCFLPLPLLPALAFASSSLLSLVTISFRCSPFLFFSFPHCFFLSRIIHQQRFPFLALSSSK